MVIYAMHGVTDQIEDRLTYRNIVKKKNFIAFLELKRNKIVTLNEAILRGDGVVITIDDSTMASYNAACILKDLEIPGIWFINPKNIVNNEIYSAALLNTMLDTIDNSVIKYQDSWFKCENIKHKKKIRKLIKESLKETNNTEVERIQRIIDIGIDNGINNIIPPTFTNPVPLSYLNQFDGTSLKIGNHGWEHNFTEIMSITENYYNYQSAKDWFIKNNYITDSIYALPYGRYSKNLNDFPKDTNILLLDDRFDKGFISQNIINRINLVL